VRTNQLHFTQLQSAKQRKDESPQEFADRCRNLAYKTVPKVEDTVQQKWHYEQAEILLLASFPSRLLGEVGKFTTFNLPANMSEVLKFATTVNQAQIQERRNESFYVDEPRTRRDSVRASNRQRRDRNASKNAEGSPTQIEQRGTPHKKFGKQR
jgi:hypothetical protein